MSNNDLTPHAAIQVQAEERAVKFISDVYFRMMLAVAAASFIGFASIDSGLIQLGMKNLGRAFSLCIFGGQLLTVIAFQNAVFKLRASMTQILFILYTMLTGLTLGLVGLIYTLDSIATIGLSAAMGFAALAAYGKMTKRDLSGLGAFCLMALTMLVIYSLSIWAASFFIESPSLLNGAIKLQGFIGTLVFSGITAYEAQKLKLIAQTIAAHSTSDAEVESHVNAGALSMFMNFIGLFLSLLRLLGNRR